VPTIERDIRDVRREDVEGVYAVVHLAALSNDPIGNLNDDWTRQINDDASARLARFARDAGAERFLFSSSCIMYGMSEAAEVDETTPLNPQTEYARSKARSETAIGELASDTFSPTFLRNGTVYGLSPRMRFDTVLNNLVGSAVATGRVVVNGDGSPWRPVVHVVDVARAFVHLLEAPRELVHNQAFNVGAGHLNHRVRELADLAVAAVPGATLEIRKEPSADRRTYRADFGKFARAFPDFAFEWTAESGSRALAGSLADVGLTRADFEGPHFTRLRWLQRLLELGDLDLDLRWNTVATAR
jgi:nucleoside-diphosphate-sugar epimerase